MLYIWIRSGFLPFRMCLVVVQSRHRSEERLGRRNGLAVVIWRMIEKNAVNLVDWGNWENE